MENYKDENIEKLFSEFLPGEDGRQAAEDIREAEKILRENPAPSPTSGLLADINSKVAKALTAKRAKTLVYRAAVAAGVIILIAISVKFFEGGHFARTPVALEPMQRAVWESDGVAPTQANLVLLTDEVEQVEAEVVNLRLGGGGGNGSRELIEIETELTDVSGDFWKG
jgi:hypothetical protein